MGTTTHCEEMDFLDSAGAELLRHFAETTPEQMQGRDSFSELFDELPQSIKDLRDNKSLRSTPNTSVVTLLDESAKITSKATTSCLETPEPSSGSDLDDEINAALLSVGQFSGGLDLDPGNSPFSSLTDDRTRDSSVTSEDNEDRTKGEAHAISDTNIDYETVAAIKQAMQLTLSLNLLYTALKATYLKLCREFNYLLGKFNENERVKLALINENNELRKLLTRIVKEREIERNEQRINAESRKRPRNQIV